MIGPDATLRRSARRPGDAGIRSVVAALAPLLARALPGRSAHGEPAARAEPRHAHRRLVVRRGRLAAGHRRRARLLAGRGRRRPPRIRRTACRAGDAGRGSPGSRVIVLALASPIERYDTTLFSVHMVQHLLLAMVAAPLLVHGGADHAAPALRVARGRGAAGSCRSSTRRPCASCPRRRWRGASFAGVMWFSHFSPLFDAALEDEILHRLEHAPVPRHRAAVLVAGRRRRPEPASARRIRRGSSTSRSGCRSRRSSGWSSSRRTPCCIRTTRRSSATGACRRSRTRRWAGGIMWAGGRPRVRHRDHRRGRGLVAPRGRGGPARRRASRASSVSAASAPRWPRAPSRGRARRRALSAVPLQRGAPRDTRVGSSAAVPARRSRSTHLVDRRRPIARRLRARPIRQARDRRSSRGHEAQTSSGWIDAICHPAWRQGADPPSVVASCATRVGI